MTTGTEDTMVCTEEEDGMIMVREGMATVRPLDA